MKQLITVGQDGSLESLDFKRKGLDLRSFGRAQIRRVSEIVWDVVAQAWTVVPTQGTLKGTAIHSGNVQYAVSNSEEVARTALTAELATGTSTLLWDDYDEAVAFEVAFIQWCRLNGRGELVG